MCNRKKFHFSETYCYKYQKASLPCLFNFIRKFKIIKLTSRLKIPFFWYPGIINTNLWWILWKTLQLMILTSFFFFAILSIFFSRSLSFFLKTEWKNNFRFDPESKLINQKIFSHAFLVRLIWYQWYRQPF